MPRSSKSGSEDELGKPVDELFGEFDDTPVGSASIAQVHRAVVKDSKQVVAVKVQRPGVVEQVTDDLSIMERIVELYDLLSPSEGGYSFKQLVDELVRTSRDELDFRIEARNLERFYENNKDRPGIGSPRCYEELTTRSLLTEDFFTDPRVGEPSAVEGLSGEERDQLAYLIANNYMQQLMEDGFFHADPHAGNILITAEHGIRWIDFGMMGEMNGREREVLERSIESLIKGDAYGLKRSLLKVATPTGPVDHGALLGACENIISEVIDVDLESFDTGAVFDELAESMRKSGFELAPFLVTMGRGLVTLEGTIKLVSDKLNIMQVLAKYAADSFTPEKIARRARKVVGWSVESVEAMAALPSKAMDTLDMLQKGQVRLGMNMDVNKKAVSALQRVDQQLRFRTARSRDDNRVVRAVHDRARAADSRYPRAGVCRVHLRHGAHGLHLGAHLRSERPGPEVERRLGAFLGPCPIGLVVGVDGGLELVVDHDAAFAPRGCRGARSPRRMLTIEAVGNP